MTLDHLSEHEISGFIDQALPAEELRRVEHHLDRCADCRRELVEAARLLDSHDPINAEPYGPVAGRVGRPGRRQSWHVPAGAAGLLVAAVALLVLVRPDGAPVGGAGQDRQRAGDIQSIEMGAHSPADAGVVDRGGLRFSWSPLGATSYRFVLMREDGSLVWTSTQVDTTVVPPTTVDIPTGEILYWYVEALTVDAPARTELRSVTVRP